MDSPNDQVFRDFITDAEVAAMEIEHSKIVEEEENEKSENDPLLKLMESAKSILCEPNEGGELEGDAANSPSWSWIANRILKTCVAYSSGVTPAILLSELSLAWSEQSRSGAPKKQSEIIIKLKKKHKRAKLLNTVTIDSIYEKRFLSLSSVIEAVIIDAFFLPGTNIYMLTLGDIWSSNTIDLYLHRRFYNIADSKTGILQKGREVLLTGCYLRVAMGSSVSARLLPTEYFVVILDEDEDDDAMLLGAQFCSDSFSAISLNAAEEGTSYSFYARIEHVGRPEIRGKNVSLQCKQITLVDNDGTRLNFMLWGEQTLVANLFSVGSMLALDRPFISEPTDGSQEANELCLEYGSATQLYLVPHILHKEQVYLASTQNHYQASRMPTALNPTQAPIVSQVTLLCDSQGSIDFSNYPFRSYVADLRDKMTGISLYGIVTDIKTSDAKFAVRIDDTTGAIWAKLHFVRSWSLGRLGMGHTVYISGLSSSLAPQKSLELSWFENDVGASFFNISCLPAFLNTSCLHNLVSLSDLSICTSGTKVCRVWLDQIEHCHVNTNLSHTLCGHLVDEAPNGDLECKFCHCVCKSEVERTFNLKIALADDTAKVFASCMGQTAAELLQISPDEFYALPEEEQIMYPSSLEHEKFIVAIVNCRRKQECEVSPQNPYMGDWEVTRAMKCE